MKHFLQVVSDIFSIALAVAVLGGAYLYTNPGTLDRLQMWWAGAMTLPTIGAVDIVMLAIMGIGLVSTVLLLTRGKALLRGPANIRLIR